MAENLQNLLDRIQQEGVQTAEQKAQEIVEAAEAKARSIIEDAQAKAKADIAKAEAEASSFEQHARQTIQQAARDVVLSVQKQIDCTIQNIVQKKVSEVLTSQDLKDIILKVAVAYANGLPEETRIEVLVSKDDQAEIGDALVAEFGAMAKGGLTVSGGSGVVSGFSISVEGENVQHDFSGDAITDALCALLRPRLVELVREKPSQTDDQ